MEIDKQEVFKHFDNEIKNSPELYLDSSNSVNLTKLTESYLDKHPEIVMESEEESKIFELACDWFEEHDDQFNL